tara:strand:+ start:1369 stop:1560 length:192 start_codon:yes stop_codon:yes gene_type:complete
MLSKYVIPKTISDLKKNIRDSKIDNFTIFESIVSKDIGVISNSIRRKMNTNNSISVLILEFKK